MLGARGYLEEKIDGCDVAQFGGHMQGGVLLPLVVLKAPVHIGVGV